MRALEEGANPMLLRRGIEDATELVVAALRHSARPVEGEADLTSVATIAAKEDERIGVAVARALHRVGAEGVVTIEESQLPGIEVEFVEGMHVENGHFSPYLIQDTQRMETVFEDPHILLTNRSITHMQDLMPTLDAVMKSPRPLIIFAEKVDGAALGLLVQNNQHGTLQAVVVRAPGFGHRRIAHLHDLAAFTGGQVIAEEAGLTLQHVKPETFGSARRVVITEDATVLVEGAGTRRGDRGAPVPDPDRTRARHPGHRHRGPARAAGQAVQQPRGDPRRRLHRVLSSRRSSAAPRAPWPRPARRSARASSPAGAPRCCAPPPRSTTPGWRATTSAAPR